MPDSAGDHEQVRKILAQLRDTMEPPEARTPPIVTWLVGAIAALGLAAMIGIGGWVVTSISTMSDTLSRMDERMKAGSIKDNRYDDLARRVERNEQRLSVVEKK